MTAAKLRELEAKATEAPWKVRQMGGECFVEGNKVQGRTIAGDYKTEVLSDGDYDEKLGDAELIAYLRNHTQDFIKLIEAAERHCVKRMLDDDHELREALAAFKEQSPASVPYPKFCRHTDQCAGKTSCPRDPSCCD